MNASINTTSKYDKNPALIESYRAGNAEAGEELVLLNKPLVCALASRYTGRGTDLEELIEIGNLGLVKAINTFDLNRECAFSTYAVPLVLGEIRRYLRDDGIIKVSREYKRLLARLTKERQTRAARGEDVSLTALAEAVGVTPEDAASALHSGIPPRSLDECAYEDDGATLGSLVFDEDEEGRRFDSFCVRHAIEELPELWQRIITLRYFRDLSQQDTASVLGLNQVKVSREEKKILAHLRERLK